MANELNQNTTFSEGVASLEKSLDLMLTDLRKAAHSAIDMDDWNKAEEILASTKADIKKIETLKKKFAEFKEEAAKLGFLSGDASKAPEKPAEAPNPEAKPAEAPKSEAKPADAPKPETKPADAPKPEAKPAESPKPEAKPAEAPKPEAKPAPEPPKPQPNPAEPPKPQPAPEAPKPQPKPAEPPKPQPKPAEPPKPQPKPAPQPVSKPTMNFDVLDMDMSDDDDDKGASDPIIDACEDLITKFPFSMRLIYSNPKIGKFFTTDEVIATNDMSKPKQLSNGLWVETNVPEEKIQTFIRSVMRYCEESVNM